jgi:hypothetical protein
MRKSYGFRTFRVTELALYHSLGKLPEPELTHRFFGSSPKSVIEDEAFLVQRLASEVAGLNPRFI